MAIITYPLNNIEYTAEDAELYHATRTSGVFANDDFPITASGDGNVVKIGEGIGWIRNSKFSGKVVANKAEMSLDLGLPHATYPRIDAVVLQFNANSNASEIIVKNGNAKTNPTPPEVVRTESVYELHLYHVYREAGAASVTASNVTDLRSDEDYCGIMYDDVTPGADTMASSVYDPTGEVAEAGGITEYIAAKDYIEKSKIGTANGVAGLDSGKKLNKENMPVHAVYTQKGTCSDSLFGQPVTMDYEIKKCSSTAFLTAKITWDAGATAGGWSFEIPNSIPYVTSLWYKAPFAVCNGDYDIVTTGYLMNVETSKITISVGRGKFGDTCKTGYMYIALPIYEVW